MELLSFSLSFILSLIFFLISLFLFSFFHIQQNQSKKKPNSRGIKAYPLIGNLPEFLKNRHRFLDWVTEVVADLPTNTVIFRRPGNVRGIMTANPLNVEYVLKTRFDNFPKGDRFISMLDDFLGHGIFNSDGELWKVQRKTASFEFNTKSLRNFVVSTVGEELENRLLPLLQKTSETGETIDLQDVFERFSFDGICRLAFNEDPACLDFNREEAISGSGKLSSDFARAFSVATNFSAGRFMYAIPFLYKIKRLLNIGSERQLKEAILTVHDYATKMIRSRKKDAFFHQKDDLLSRFMANGDNSEEFLRDIIVSFILAGRDTTSTALSWFFWLLASRPDVEGKILDEIKSIRAQNPNFLGGSFSFEELRELHYLHAAISESMRLYPPVPVNQIVCLEDCILPDGTPVQKGWFVSYNTYAMGRMESIWGKDCREFSPERWIEDGVFRPENPFKYPIFHAGPRICLGKEMAYIQMKFIAACMIERFKIEVLNKDTCPQHVLQLTLRMKGGLPVRVRERGMEKAH